MRWLIVEDALRDRKGHWFEYISTFTRDLRTLGDEVTVLADRAAELFLVEQLQVQPVLPASIWHRMSDGASALRRYLRVPVHAWQTYRALGKYFRQNDKFDVVFVPTVLVHHLLGWTWLIKGPLRQTPFRIILFFPNTPMRLAPTDGEPTWEPAPTAKLFSRLIRSLRGEIERGSVILGVETHPMRGAFTRLTGTPCTYFPHPVQSMRDTPMSTLNHQLSSSITIGSYGGARHEKGNEVLVAAVEEYTRRYPDSRIRFALQCVGGDPQVWRRLENNSKVNLISNYFTDGEYAQHLEDTDALLLPYHCSSYALRVSRVVIEAMVGGIPVVATRGTTLAQQAEEFGALVQCEDGDVESLVEAIGKMEENFQTFRRRAEQQKQKAREHFSIREFRSRLMEKVESN